MRTYKQIRQRASTDCPDRDNGSRKQRERAVQAAEPASDSQEKDASSQAVTEDTQVKQSDAETETEPASKDEEAGKQEDASGKDASVSPSSDKPSEDKSADEMDQGDLPPTYQYPDEVHYHRQASRFVGAVDKFMSEGP